MAATILPGYDFQVDEIPTYGKFIAQAQGIDINNLSYTDLEDDTSFIFNSQESLGSGATEVTELEGGLWTDPTGEVWVSVGVYDWWGSSGYSGETYVQVPMFKLWRGGWDTIRGFRHPGTSNFSRLQSVAAGSVPNGYSPTNIARETNFFQHDSNGPRDLGYAQDTPASGVYYIVAGRGTHYISVDRSISQADMVPYRWTITAPTAYDIRSVAIPGGFAPRYAVGEVYGGNSSKSYDGGTNVWGPGEGVGWFYGRVAANDA